MEARPALLVLFLAAVWPLGAYAQIPYVPLPLGIVAAVAVFLAMIVRWRANRRLRPPFEYWWPPLAILIIASLPIARDGLGIWTCAAYAVIFLGPIVLVQSRADAALACAALAAGCGVSALASFGAQAGLLLPTEINLDTTTALAGPEDFRRGVLLYVHGIIAGAYASLHPLISRRMRKLVLLASVIAGSWLLLSVLPMLPALAMPANLGAMFAESPMNGLAAALALWLAARVAARSALRPVDEESPSRIVAPALLLLAACAIVVWGTAPDPAFALVLGLIAAHDAPWAVRAPARIPIPLWAPVLACVLIQCSGLLPLAKSDPRNHAARCESLLAKEDWRELDRRLAFLLDRHPSQPAYTMIQARSLAAQGWPEAASEVYCSSTYPEDDTARYGISFSVHRQALMDALRDHASRLPEGRRGLFFERALIHSGERDNALRFLALQSAGDVSALADDPKAVAPVAQQALALLLGDPALLDRLSTELGEEAPAFLAGSGVDILKLPDNAPAALGPVLVRAIAGPRGIYIDVWAGLDPAQRKTGRIVLVQPSITPERLHGLTWSGWKSSDSGAGKIVLSLPDGVVGEISLPELVGIQHGTAGASLPEQGETAAIALYIP